MKPLTSKQTKILKNANARLHRILELGDAGYYAPAVAKALERLNGVTTFTKDTLQAAKNFMRSKTSTVRGVKQWAAQNNYYYPQTPKPSTAMTTEERQLLDRVNKRLKYARTHGYDIPKRYQDIQTFTRETLELAKQFDISPKTRRRPKKYVPGLTAEQGKTIRSVYQQLLIKEAKETYYAASNEAEQACEPLGYELKDVIKASQPDYRAKISDIEREMHDNDFDKWLELSQQGVWQMLYARYGEDGLHIK